MVLIIYFAVKSKKTGLMAHSCMNILRFGNIILLLITAVVYGCSYYFDDGYEVYTVTYRYQNESGVDLTLEVYNKSEELIHNWDIPNNTTLTLEPETSEFLRPFSYSPEPTQTSREPNLYSYRSPATPKSHKVQIRFSDRKCVREMSIGDRNIFNPKNYLEYHGLRNDESETNGLPIYNRSEFTLTYIFKPEDLISESVTCEISLE